jgi:hypothetical protein
MQSLIDARGIDDMKSGSGKRKGGCFNTASDDDLRFVCETLLSFV